VCKHMTSHDHRDTTLSTSKFIQRLTLLLFILLPIQTRWIAVPATLHGGYWEYGTVSLYATQIFIFLIAAYYLLQTYKNKKQPLSLLIVKSWVGLFITKHKVLTLFLFWLLLSILWAPRTAAIGVWLLLFLTAVCFWYVLQASKLSLKVILVSVGIGMLISGGIGMIQFAQQHVPASSLWGVAEQNPQDLGPSTVETSLRRWLRGYGTFPHPNLLGGWMVLGLLCWLGVFLATHPLTSDKDSWARLMAIVGTVVGAGGLWLSFSRSAWLGFCVFLFLFWLYVLIKKRTWFIPVFKWTLLIALMLVISAAVFEDPFRARTSFVDQSSLAQFRLEEQSQNDRVKQWQEAKDIGFSKTAGVGSGVGNYTAFLGRLFPSREVYQLQPMHSTPVLVGLELGIIGSFLLLLLIIQYIKKFVQHPFGMFLLIAVLGMMLFDHYWWSLYPGVLATTFAFWFAAQNITKPEQLRIFGAS